MQNSLNRIRIQIFNARESVGELESIKRGLGTNSGLDSDEIARLEKLINCAIEKNLEIFEEQVFSW